MEHAGSATTSRAGARTRMHLCPLIPPMTGTDLTAFLGVLPARGRGFRLAGRALARRHVHEGQERPSRHEEDDEGQDGIAARSGGHGHYPEDRRAEDTRELLEHGEEREELR